MANNKKSDSRILADSIISGMQERKANNIVLVDLRKVEHAMADYFVICHGDSNTQVSALADSVIEQTLKDIKEKPWHKEGYENCQWVLLDYFDVVAHVFYKEDREFYNLESLWADAKLEEIDYEI